MALFRTGDLVRIPATRGNTHLFMVATEEYMCVLGGSEELVVDVFDERDRIRFVPIRLLELINRPGRK